MIKTTIKEDFLVYKLILSIGLTYYVHCKEIPEQDFEVVRKLRPACITRVHGDEDSTGWLQRKLSACEEKVRHIIIGFNLIKFCSLY